MGCVGRVRRTHVPLPALAGGHSPLLRAEGTPLGCIGYCWSVLTPATCGGHYWRQAHTKGATCALGHIVLQGEIGKLGLGSLGGSLSLDWAGKKEGYAWGLSVDTQPALFLGSPLAEWPGRGSECDM